MLKLLAWTKNARNKLQLRNIVLLPVVDLLVLASEETTEEEVASTCLPVEEVKDQEAGRAVVAVIQAEGVMTAATEAVAAFAMVAALVEVVEEEEISDGVEPSLRPSPMQTVAY